MSSKKKKKREKRKHKRELAQKRLLNRQTKSDLIPGDASKYFDKLLHPLILKELQRDGWWVKPFTRVSFRHQKKKGYLDSQVERMKTVLELAELSDRMYPIEKMTCSAFDSESHKAPPGYSKPHYPRLEKIAFEMKQREKIDQVKIALVFESVDRAIRPDDYATDDRDTIITEEKFKEFAEITQHLRCLVVCSPDCCERDVAFYRTIPNRFNKKYPGWKADRKRIMEPMVLNLRRIEGKDHKPKYSYGQIATMLNLSIDLVRSWCRKAKLKGLL